MTLKIEVDEPPEGFTQTHLEDFVHYVESGTRGVPDLSLPSAWWRRRPGGLRLQQGAIRPGRMWNRGNCPLHILTLTEEEIDEDAELGLVLDTWRELRDWKVFDRASPMPQAAAFAFGLPSTPDLLEMIAVCKIPPPWLRKTDKASFVSFFGV